MTKILIFLLFQVIREISKKVSQIQNAGLGEFRIRDLNDEINKLLREKGHWEARIIELVSKLVRFSKTAPKNRTNYFFFKPQPRLVRCRDRVPDWQGRTQGP